jgi:outer membrane murein-binding lipoprotein Lpp
MSVEIESLSNDMNSRRPGGNGTNPMLLAAAIVGLLLAIYAHWRIGQFDNRIDRVRGQVVEIRASQDRLSGQLTTLGTRMETSQRALRTELRSLHELPAQIAVLGRGVEELRARTEAPQRAWARAEAMYLLDLPSASSTWTATYERRSLQWKRRTRGSRRSTTRRRPRFAACWRRTSPRCAQCRCPILARRSRGSRRSRMPCRRSRCRASP